MGLYAKRSSGGGQPVPEGVTVGICVGVYDLGTHFNEQFGKRSRKVAITWELPEHKGQDKEGKEYTRTISGTYTLSLHEKAQLRKVLEAWRGKAFTDEELDGGFDLSKLIGKACQLQIGHVKKGEKTYANILAIMAVPKGMPTPAASRLPVYVELSDEGGWTLPEGLPAWIKDMISSSEEWQAHFGVADGEREPLPIDEPDAADAKPLDTTPF